MFLRELQGSVKYPDAENFAKVFTGLMPLNILAKSSVS